MEKEPVPQVEGEERKESERNAFFLTAGKSNGLMLDNGQIWNYYEEYEFFRERIPMPATINQTAWFTLRNLRDGLADGDWKEAEDSDKEGEIYTRVDGRFYRLKKPHSTTECDRGKNYSVEDMSRMLQLIVSQIQKKEKRVLFEIAHYDWKSEWGLLVMENGQVLEYRLESTGNRMQDKFHAAKPTTITIGEEKLLILEKQAFDIEPLAEGIISERPASTGGGTILMSYASESPFIVHTEGRVLLIHRTYGGACHRLFDSLRILTSKKL